MAALREEALAAVVETADKMQLAATQRPHPPPVPPRPSRQVVAEALKRSPRPPCPTRQAPPPPNTKPWRSDRDRSNNRQQQQVVSPAAGRTVVYESIKDTVPKETGNESGGRDEPARLVVVGGGSGDELVPRVASERRTDEDARYGNPRERRHRSTTVPGQEYRGNFSESSDVARREGRAAPDEHFSNGVASGDEKSSSTNDNNGKQCNDDEPAWDNSLQESAALGSLDRSSVERLDDVVSRCHHRLEVDKSKSSLPEKSYCSERRPTPTQRSCAVKHRVDTTKSAEETRSANDSSANDRPSNVSNVLDRGTVVVVDEPDRRAASNDDGGDEKDRTNENDNDNDNIHRQDWLEAGIHYSSTQIRLSGEDGDIVDGSRVNGYNRCENEKFSDTNVPR